MGAPALMFAISTSISVSKGEAIGYHGTTVAVGHQANSAFAAYTGITATVDFVLEPSRVGAEQETAT